MTVIAFSSAIGPIPITCRLSERHSSEVEVTKNPIETGAEVNDHAYVKPKKVTLEIGDANAALTYNALIRFQESRVPFILVTGLTVYKDMLIEEVEATRDKTYSRVLKASVKLRQVIIVGTAMAAGQPGGTTGRGAATPSKETANNAATANRAAGPVQSGDNPTTTVNPSTSKSILKQMF